MIASPLRVTLVVSLLAGLFGQLLLSQNASAQATASISITAGIASVAKITICDPTADFGTGLTPTGSSTTGTADRVTVSSPGNASLGQGVIYSWLPSCPVTATIQGSLPWSASTCATENSGTSNLSIAAGDFRWGFKATFYADFARQIPFSTTCKIGNVISHQGTASIVGGFSLRVDQDNTPGTFISTTTWQVTN